MKNEITAIWKAVCKVLLNNYGQIFATHLSYLALGVLLFTPLAVDVLEEQTRLTTVERLLIHTSVLFNRPIPKRTYRDQSP